MRIKTRGRRATILAAWLVAVGGWLLYWMEPLAVFPVLEFLTPQLVYRVRTDRPLVGLSFDDGPHPSFTPQVLDILDRYEAKATFFLIGERALLHPQLAARIKGSGHEVGNHYFIGGSTLRHSDADFIAYLDRTEWALGVDGEQKLFRPPDGVAWPRQLKLARERGYLCVLGSAYPHDPAHPPVWYIRWLTSKNLEPGAIIILHDGITDSRRTVAALPGILANGRRKGLRFVSIGALIKRSPRR